jgi:hypothetical protein
MANIYKPKYKKDTMQAGSIGSNGTIYANTSGVYGDVVGNLDHASVPGTEIVPYNPVFAASQMASQSGNPAGKAGGVFKGLGGFTINNRPLREWFKTTNPNLGWTSKSGLQGFGKKLGKQANVINSVYQLANAASAANALDKAKDSYSDVAGDIITSANSNPLLYQFLTSDQMAQIRALKKSDGEVDSNFSDFLPQDIGDFGNIAKGALIGGITGGIPGAVIGGLGNAVSGGIENVTKEQQMSTQELEALLAAVQEAEMQYKSMKRPALGGLGIQQRYLDMYR